MNPLIFFNAMKHDYDFLKMKIFTAVTSSCLALADCTFSLADWDRNVLSEGLDIDF